ncbi:MAG TPA: FadR/GntR family transcriptional regulator, partial [Vicinamibacterales bacterium]|nr:FadR/GntR family transcriptional regulator [Vicinamibacterales bacterium]
MASSPHDGPPAAVARVVDHVRTLIAEGRLRPGDRLPAERALAVALGVSRATVRAGLRSLAAMGAVRIRHGAGTFIAAGPPVLGSEPLRLLAELHGFTRAEMFEARRLLEAGVAALAAERATPDDIAAIADEVASMFAALDDPQVFLVHDIRFHRAIAAASGNPILASIVEMVSALFYEQRRRTAGRARDLREAAEMHRRIYEAIRARDPHRAGALMNDHLRLAQRFQEQEDAPSVEGREAAAPAPAAAAATPVG